MHAAFLLASFEPKLRTPPSAEANGPSRRPTLRFNVLRYVVPQQVLRPGAPVFGVSIMAPFFFPPPLTDVDDDSGSHQLRNRNLPAPLVGCFIRAPSNEYSDFAEALQATIAEGAGE